MADRRYRLIRGDIFKAEFYRSPQGGPTEKTPLPPRRPSKHRATLLRQLDLLLEGVKKRPSGSRDPEAGRELIAVEPEATHQLPAESFADAARDVRVIGVTDDGVVLLDAKDAELGGLRRKIDAYADDSKKTPKGSRKNDPAIAPIHEIRFTGEPDLLGPRLRAAQIDPNTLRWFEVACRGGVRVPNDIASSRRQIHRQLSALGFEAPQEFVATEQVVFFLRSTLHDLRRVIAMVDCVQEFDLAPPDVRDWLMVNKQPVREIQAFVLRAPPVDAPSVVLLDTGIATAHPMLKAAVLKADSAVPGDASAEDVHGHGTQMAGVALHGDGVGGAVDARSAVATHWLHSVKLLARPRVGSAAEENRRYWPRITEDAVTLAEAGDTRKDRPRVFALATSYGIDIVEPTYWSHAIDRLAFGDGQDRLLCVATGNADVDDVALLQGYPTLNLQQTVQEPAQAANALTVGAFTTKTRIPPEPIYASARPIGPSGGISPHTSAGLPAEGFGPDVVMEGGNVAFDGALPDSFVETLTTLTTGRDFLRAPLSRICGTSEATARVSRLATDIWNAERDLRPRAVRALIVHSASHTDAMVAQFPNIDERLAICGHGVPDAEFASACAADRATVVFDDQMPNAEAIEEPKKRLPKTARGKTVETKLKRVVKFYKLPVPEELLLSDPDREVELRVTLSYFPEPNTFRRRVSHGLDLKWDMQGPTESADDFRVRVNKLARGDKGKAKTKSFPWDLRMNRRSRGTVQSDRWTGKASLLAGEKLIAVVPVLGWWERRPALRMLSMPFTLVVTVRAAGLDIYQPIRSAVEAVVELDAT